MSLLIETICLKDGKFMNLKYHEQRAQRALQLLYESTAKPGLEDYLKNTEFPTQGFYKCRITYNDQFRKVEFINYEKRIVNSLKIIVDNEISYAHKFEDRHELNALYSKRELCDDILIVKQGLITDTSYANIVFKESDHWVTPTSYLLAGTMRQNLLDKKIITEDEIRVTDLARFKKFKLINAMVGFDGPEIDVSNIVQ
ncbi:MAG TPA: aminotransferase class IV [Cyclobacteriaceae bacterium]|nr:aminotransferase class IV [Cyclobacteriaceae bacterium]